MNGKTLERTPGKVFLDRFFLGVNWICRISLVFQVIVTVYVVFGRYVLDSTPRWGEELSLFFMVWFSLLSSALSIRDDSHLKVSLVDIFFGEKVVRICEIFGLVVILIFSLYMIFFGFKFLEVASINRMTGINVNLSWLYASVPLSGVAWCLALLERIWRLLR